MGERLLNPSNRDRSLSKRGISAFLVDAMAILLEYDDVSKLEWDDVCCGHATPNGKEGTTIKKVQDVLSALAFEFNKVLNVKGYQKSFDRNHLGKQQFYYEQPFL